jgi:ABC-2 type transport system permease protein
LLLTLLTKIGVMRQMAYRPQFLFMITGKVIRIGLLLLFFQAVFMKVDHIGLWTYNQILLLFATFHLVDYLMSITFHRNLAFHLPQLIRTGELDSRMLMPVNLLFLLSFENIDLIDFMSFLPSVGFLGYVFYRLEFAFSWGQVLSYVLLLINALLFLFSVVLIIATISFWTTQSLGLARIFDNVLKVGRYPLDIFEGFLKIVLVYFLPLVFIAQIPSQALLGLLAPSSVLNAFAVTLAFLVFAILLWRLGQRNYMSASS